VVQHFEIRKLEFTLELNMVLTDMDGGGGGIFQNEHFVVSNQTSL
jgi:hypothetical protein